ncbi:MAG TPA: hypothetical protein DCQ06_09920 [Myxococcales bacterium]|nr:hypothetical protein [Myxococcales bacterium]HAN31901.1 hypothetical protein [Myxococcales bacterium]
MLWAAVIWVSSSSATAHDPQSWTALILAALPPFSHWDKVAHLLAFALLAWLLRHASRASVTQASRASVALTCTWGAIDEVHQAFVVGRTASAGDWLADSMGALLAIALYNRVAATKTRQYRPGDLP